MALVLTEPFNNFTAAPWWNLDGGHGFGEPYVAHIVAGRTGTCAEVYGNGLAAAYYTISAPSRTDTLTIGFAYRSGGISSSPIFSLHSDGNTVEHALLSLNFDGGLEFRSQSSNKWLTAANTVVAGTWVYIELSVKMHDTTGFATLRVNGTEVATAINIDTKATSTDTTFDTLRLLPRSLAGGHFFDDMYIRNDGTFQGDPTVLNVYDARQAVRVGLQTSGALNARTALRVAIKWNPDTSARQALRVALQEQAHSSRQALRVAEQGPRASARQSLRSAWLTSTIVDPPWSDPAHVTVIEITDWQRLKGAEIFLPTPTGYKAGIAVSPLGQPLSPT
ncbi:MAG TPA: hypothetical protein VFP27_02625 [Mycobacterium sp.]|nr:hypothetical protein [Mycobacterium sp.]